VACGWLYRIRRGAADGAAPASVGAASAAMESPAVRPVRTPVHPQNAAFAPTIVVFTHATAFPPIRCRADDPDQGMGKSAGRSWPYSKSHRFPTEKHAN